MKYFGKSISYKYKLKLPIKRKGFYLISLKSVRRRRLGVGHFQRINREIAGLKAQRQPRRAVSIVATSIFFIPIIALKARFASSPPGR
jgi:hypothetical protein